MNQNQINNGSNYQHPMETNSYYSNNQNADKLKNKNTQLIMIVAIILLVIIIGIFIFTRFFSNKQKIYEPIMVSSTFEQVDDYYVLKDEKGKILLDNITAHGQFCNGTTRVKNFDGDYAIIDGNGKFVVEYGKYDRIDQYSSWGGVYYCFYEVNNPEKYQKYILKYNGEIFYSNDEDTRLNNVDMHVYETTNKYVVFETEDNYQFVNYLGEVFFTLAKVDAEEISIMKQDGEDVDDNYLTIYYNNKTYIYSLNSFKQKYTFDGQFSIKDLHVNLETKKESLIIFGYPDANDDDKTKTYLYYNGKCTFETDRCLNVGFENENDLRCLIENGGVFEYYDIKGNKLDKK